MDTQGVRQNTHYHIRINTGNSYAVQTVYGYKEMLDAVEKANQMVKDLTGATLLNSTEYVFNFSNGASVKWNPCYTEICGIS